MTNFKQKKTPRQTDVVSILMYLRIFFHRRAIVALALSPASLSPRSYGSAVVLSSDHDNAVVA